MHMRGRSRTRGSFTFGSGVAVLTAMAVLVGLIMSVAPVAAAASGPTVFWGAKTGPINLPAKKTATVAALPLPAGGYFVTATAVLVGTGGSSGSILHAANDVLSTRCRLVLGSAADQIVASPTWEDSAGSRVPILLTVAGRLNSPGKARLRCWGGLEHGDVRIRDVRISAIKAGRLTTRGSSFSTKTTGSGSPRIISMKLSPKIIAGDNSFHEVGQIDVPAGRWWAIAKAYASTGQVNGTYACSLAAGIDRDDLEFGLATPISPVEAIPLGLQVVHEFATRGAVGLRCKGPAAFVVDQVTITLVKAGKLSNRWLDIGSGWTTGSGSPRIISGWSDGPRAVPVQSGFTTIRKLDLPKGRWMVLAKLWFEAGSLPDGSMRRIYCRLVFGADKSPSQLRYANNVTRVAPMVLSIDHRSTSKRPVKLQCRRLTPGGTGDVYFIKITALRAGSLIKRRL